MIGRDIPTSERDRDRERVREAEIERVSESECFSTNGFPISYVDVRNRRPWWGFNQ